VFSVLILDVESIAGIYSRGLVDSIFIYELSINLDQHGTGLWISLNHTVGPRTILEFLSVGVDDIVVIDIQAVSSRRIKPVVMKGGPIVV